LLCGGSSSSKGRQGLGTRPSGGGRGFRLPHDLHRDQRRQEAGGG